MKTYSRALVCGALVACLCASCEQAKQETKPAPASTAPGATSTATAAKTTTTRVVTTSSTLLPTPVDGGSLFPGVVGGNTTPTTTTTATTTATGTSTTFGAPPKK